MPVKREAIEAGLEFEREFAESIGGRLQPGSGNQWFAKLDVDGRTVLWWLRSTQSRSYRLTADDVHEAIAGARGPGAPDVVPGMALRIEGAPDLAIFTQADLFAILRGDVPVVARQATKAIKNRAFADVPLLSRTE